MRRVRQFQRCPRSCRLRGQWRERILMISLTILIGCALSIRKEFSLGDGAALEVIDSAVAAELFRRRETGRLRRWISRRLERLAELARALSARVLS